MANRDLLKDLPKIVSWDKDYEHAEFKCKYLDSKGKFKPKHVVVTTKRVKLYKDESKEGKPKRVGMSKLNSICINPPRDQLVLVSDNLNTLLFTKKAEEILKLILAIKEGDDLDVYAIQEHDLQFCLKDEDFPYSEDKVTDNEGESCNIEFTELKTALPIKSTPDKVGMDDLNEETRQITEMHRQNGSSSGSKTGSDEESKFDDCNNLDCDDYLNNVDYLNMTKTLTTTKKTLKPKVVMKLGTGASGKVFLVRDEDKNFYAMKRIRKDKVVETSSVEQLILERKVLTELQHPFLLNLIHVTESPERFYFFCEYVKGGDLQHQLKKKKGGFSLKEIMYIGAQIVIALEALHLRAFVHRDLKPANVLIDENGYIRLADFGIAKDLTCCKNDPFASGTFEYMAPETMSDNDYRYGYQIDWWSLGVVLYELHYNHTPFEGGSMERIVQNVHQNDVKFWQDHPDEDPALYDQFKDLLYSLLEKKPKERLGYNTMGEGADAIKEHKFFTEVDFDELDQQLIDPPFKPVINYKKLKKYMKRKGINIGEIYTDSKSKYKDLLETALTTSEKVRARNSDFSSKDVTK